MKLKQVTGTRSYYSEDISVIDKSRFLVTLRSTFTAVPPIEIDFAEQWNANVIHISLFPAIAKASAQWVTYATAIETGFSNYQNSVTYKNTSLVASFDAGGIMATASLFGFGSDFLIVNDPYFSLGDNHRLYVFTGYNTKISLINNAGDLSLQITSDAGGLIYGQRGSTALTGNSLSIELGNEANNGAFGFGIAPKLDDLNELNAGLIYFISRNKLNNPFLHIQSNVFSEIPAAGISLNCIFFPYDQSDDALNSVFQIADPTQRLISSIKTDDGNFIQLEPVNGSAGFIMHQYPGTLDGPATEYYLTPRGQFSLNPAGGAENGLYYLQTGVSGAQSLNFSKGDLIEFVPGQYAMINGQLSDDGISIVPNANFDTSRLVNNTANNTYTSWITIRPQSAAAINYFDQPHNAATYLSVGSDFVFNRIQKGPLVPASAAAPVELPVFPHHGYVGGDGTIGPPFFQEAEIKVFSYSRIAQVGATRAAALFSAAEIEPGLRQASLTAPAAPLLTPQGFLVTLTGSVISSIVIGNSQQIDIKIDNPLPAFANALMRDKVFAPFSSNFTGGILAAGGKIGLTIFTDYVFDLFPAVSAADPKLASYFINKFHADAISTLITGEVVKWSNYDTISQLTALQQGVTTLLKGTAGDSDYDAFYARWNDPNWNGILTLNASITQLPQIITGLFPKGVPLPPIKYLGLDITNPVTGGAAISLNQSSVFGLIDYEDLTPLLPPTGNDEFAYKLKQLKVRFENARIVDFQCKVLLGFSQLFYDGIDSGTDPMQIIEIDGTYSNKDGKDSYSFVWNSDLTINFKRSILQSIDLKRIEYLMDGNSYSFAIDAILSIMQLPSPAIDLFSFDKLAINGLRLNFDYGPANLRFDASHINFNINLNVSRPKSFFSWFPVSLKNFLFSGGSGISLDPVSLGFIALGGVSNVGLSGFNFGLVLDLNLGSLGALLPDLKDFSAEILLSWAPNFTNISFGLRLPNLKINSFDIGLQGILDLHADQLNLVQKPNFIFIELVNAYLEILGHKIPDDGNYLSAILGMQIGSKNAKLPSTAWFVEYEQTDKNLLLALGEHFGAIADVDSTSDAVQSAMTTLPLGTDIESGNIPDGVINAAHDWLIAFRKLKVAGLFDLNLIFWDGKMDGLSIGIADFYLDILYKKISDTTGEWSVDFGLPDDLRHLQIGPVGVVLPNVGIAVYSNGGFDLDIGMPVGYDYSHSGAAYLPPFVGMLGANGGLFKSGDLQGVPLNIKTLIRAGTAVRLGLGIAINEGPLSAGISITVTGSFEGALGYAGGVTFAPDFVSLAGTVGIIGEIYGYVDFAIIKASLHAIIAASVGVSWATGQPIVLFVDGEISVEVSFDIDLGFFSITINLSFSMHMHYEWSIGAPSNAMLFADVLAGPPPPVPTIADFQAHVAGLHAPVALPVVFASEVTVKDNNVYFLPVLHLASNALDAGGNLVPYPAAVKTMTDALLSVVYGYLQSINSGNNPAYPEVLAFDLAISALGAKNILSAALVNDLFDFSVGVQPSVAGSAKQVVAFFPMLSGIVLTSGLFPAATGGKVDYALPAVSQTYLDAVTDVFSDYLVTFQTSDAAAKKAAHADPPAIPLSDVFLGDYFDFVLKTALVLIKQGMEDNPSGAGLDATTWDKVAQADSFYTEVYNRVNRFFRTGLRIPTVSDTSTMDSLFSVLCQQYTVDFSVTNTIINIAYAGQVNSFTLYTQDPASGLALYKNKDISAGLVISNTLAPPFRLSSYAASLNSSFTGGGLSVYAIPQSTMDLVATNSFPLSFNLTQGSVTARFTDLQDSQTQNVSDFAIATLIELKFTPTGVTNLFSVDGFTATQAFLLQELIRDSGALASLEISFFAVTPAGKGLGYKDMAPAGDVTLFKTNLSSVSKPTANFALDIALEAAVQAAVPNHAVLGTDTTGFIGLLRECSIVNDNGFYIRADSWAAAGTAAFEVALLIRPPVAAGRNPIPAQQLMSYHTHVITPGQPLTSNMWYLLSTNLQQVSPAIAPHTAGFNVTRYRSPAGAGPQQSIDFLYSALAYGVTPAAGSAVAAISADKILPANPVTVEKQPNQWQYQHVVPLLSNAELAVNRYGAVGSAYTLNYNWRDLYGNNNTSAAFNYAMTKHTYFDKLVAAGAWPMVSVAYAANTAVANTLSISLVFTYNAALTALQLGSVVDQYKLISDQLNDQVSVVASALVFNDDTKLKFTAADALAGLRIFIAQILVYLQDNTKTKPIPVNIDILIDPATFVLTEPAQLDVSLAIVRNLANVHPDLLKYIDPLLITNYGGGAVPVPSDPSVTGANEVFVSVSAVNPDVSTSIITFAKNINQNLKIAGDEIIAGTGLNNLGEKAIWLISKNWLSPAALAPGADGSSRIFAIQPLSLKPWSQPGVTNLADGTTVTIVNNDLDKTMRQVLSGIETLLAPNIVGSVLAMPAASGVYPIDTLLNAKTSLAEFYSSTVINVKQNDTTSPSALVTDDFNQDMLQNLSAAYGVDVLVSTPYNCSHQNKQEYRLWYNFTNPATVDGFKLSPVKIQWPVGGLNEQLHFTVNFPALQNSMPEIAVTTGVSVTQIEHAIAAGPDGYESSLWIHLIDIGDTPETTIQVNVPVIIREYPAAPFVASHSFSTVPPAPGGTLFAMVQEAKQWTYTLNYNSPQLAEDCVYLQVELNTDPVQTDTTNANVTENGFVPETAVQAALLYKALAPALVAPSAPATVALMQQFISTVAAITGGTAEAPKVDLIAMAGPVLSEFKINVGDYENGGYTVKIQKTVNDKSPFDLQHDVTFTLYQQAVPPNLPVALPLSSSNFDPTSGTLSLFFATPSVTALSDTKTFAISGLDIMKYNQAWPGTYVTRNENVLDLNDHGGISGAFVYETPLVKFGSSLKPVLTCDTLIPDTPAGETLEKHLQDILTAIYTDGTQPEPEGGTLSVECFYCDQLSYQGAAGALQVQTPAALIPNLAAAGSQPDATGYSPNSELIASRIKAWATEKDPNQSGSYILDIKIFAVNGTPLLLFDLTSLAINLSAITP